jgi:hypothetical protein
MLKYIYIATVLIFTIHAASATKVLIIANDIEPSTRVASLAKKHSLLATDLTAMFYNKLAQELRQKGDTVEIKYLSALETNARQALQITSKDNFPKSKVKLNFWQKLNQPATHYQGLNIQSAEAKLYMDAWGKIYDMVMVVSKVEFRKPFWSSLFVPGFRMAQVHTEIYTSGNALVAGKSLSTRVIFKKSIFKTAFYQLFLAPATNAASWLVSNDRKH